VKKIDSEREREIEKDSQKDRERVKKIDTERERGVERERERERES
jgi:hypothetical protein